MRKPYRTRKWRTVDEGKWENPMRRSMLLLVFVLLLMLAALPAASAHVHGITPLNNLACTGVDNTVTGGNATNGGPADDANEGPIEGLIPRDTGRAPLTGGDGGRNAPVPVCL